MGEFSKTVYGGYKCTSPTIAKFHQSTADVRILLGPRGSGKSFGAQGEVMMLAQEMPPCKDGVRRSAYAFLRDTATNLKDTTMVTWCKLFPEIINGDQRTGITKVTWSHPMDMRVQQDLPDGTRLDLMIYCRHQASPIDAENLKSLELTGFYANEVNMIPEACFFQAISSMGRYPDPRNLSINPETGKPYVPRFCALADSNMPHEKHWLWQKYLNPPKGWEFFRQPPAMFYLGQSKNGRPLFQRNTGQRIAQGILPAENIANLGGGFKYYERQVYGRKLAESLVFVCAQPGVITDGLPVYGNYSADVHYTGKPIPFDINKTLFLGFDWGLWPTCVFAQMNDAGQLQIIDMIDGEGEKMGIEQLWTGKLRAKLVNDYRWGSGSQLFAIGDPATGVSQVNMSTCADYLQSQGLTVVPCVTNDPVERIGAVDHFLRSTVYGGKPALVIAKAAYKIHEGMSGYYCLKEKAGAAGTTYSAVPDKNEWSHSQDCVQYIAHAVKNPSLYNIEWRNRNKFGQSDITQLPTQPKVGMAGVV